MELDLQGHKEKEVLLQVKNLKFKVIGLTTFSFSLLSFNLI